MTIRFSRGDFLWLEIAQGVFAWAENDYGPLNERYQLFVAVSETAINPRDFAYARWSGNNRPPNDRIAIFKAFVYHPIRRL